MKFKLSTLSRSVSKYVTDNSPLILTATGVVGVGSTAYLTWKAATRSAELIVDANITKIDQGGTTGLTKSEKFALTWKLYIAPFASGVLTCGAIIAANRISSRRAAAAAAAFMVAQEMSDDYKAKALEVMGRNKDQKVRDEISQERVDANPTARVGIIPTGVGDDLFMDCMTGRYFECNMEEVMSAMNHVNQMVFGDAPLPVPLNTFYNWLNLSNVPIGEEVGFTADNPLKITPSTTISDTRRPCMVINYEVVPIRRHATSSEKRKISPSHLDNTLM